MVWFLNRTKASSSWEHKAFPYSQLSSFFKAFSTLSTWIFDDSKLSPDTLLSYQKYRKGYKVHTKETTPRLLYSRFHGWMTDINEDINSKSAIDALIGPSCWLHKFSSQLQNVTDAPFMLLEVHWLIAWSLLHWRLTTEMGIARHNTILKESVAQKHDVSELTCHVIVSC